MINRFFRFLTAALVVYSVGIVAMAQTKAFDVSRMDTSADACDDFFQFANGNWVKNTPIPPSQSRWGSFNSLAETIATPRTTFSKRPQNKLMHPAISS